MEVENPSTKPKLLSNNNSKQETQRAEQLGWIIDQLSVIAVARGQIIAPERLRINAEDLIDLSREQLSVAFGKVRRECGYYPSVAEVRRLAGAADEEGSLDAEARAAWEMVELFVRKYVDCDVHGNYGPEHGRRSLSMRTRYQHGNLQLRKRKNGPDVWVYRWREYGPAGEVSRRGEIVGTIDDFRTKAKALKACEHLQLTANSDNPTSGNITFGAVLDRYVAEEMPERHSTNLAYRSYMETHIRLKWSEWPLRKLTAKGSPFIIEQWLKTLELAPKTKGNIRNVMAVIFSCAMRWGLVDLGVNPVALVRVKGVSRRQSEPRVLDPKEIQALTTRLAEPCRTAVIVALSTGLRCSELFALKWLDFQWDSLTVLVRRAIVDGVVGDVKTKYSQSGLPLDPALAEVLFSWKRTSEFGKDGDWIFASPQKAGELPLRSGAMLENQIKPAASAAELGDGVGWHTFRHTYSTMLRQLGVDLKVQQELLRHADIRTTMNVYTQAVSEQKRAAHSKVVQMVLAS